MNQADIAMGTSDKGCYLVYDQTICRTVGVIAGDSMEVVIPADPCGRMLTSEALDGGHKLKTLRYAGSYKSAVRRFSRQRVDGLDMAFEHREIDPAKEEKRYRKQGRRYRSERIPKEMRKAITAARLNRMSLRKVAARFDVSLSTVQRILAAEKRTLGYEKSPI